VIASSPVCAASVLPEPCAKSTAGESLGPAALQRKPFKRSVPLETTTVSCAKADGDWPTANADNHSKAHAKKNWSLTGRHYI
jgi:hypothetical protein